MYLYIYIYIYVCVYIAIDELKLYIPLQHAVAQEGKQFCLGKSLFIFLHSAKPRTESWCICFWAAKDVRLTTETQRNDRNTSKYHECPQAASHSTCLSLNLGCGLSPELPGALGLRRWAAQRLLQSHGGCLGATFGLGRFVFLQALTMFRWLTIITSWSQKHLHSWCMDVNGRSGLESIV